MGFLHTQEVVGIDIGRRFIKAVVMRKGKGGIEVLNASSVRIESSPQNTEEVRRGKVTEALIKTLEQFGKKSRRVALACPGRVVFPRIVKLPPVAKGKLKQIVQYETQQQIPFSLEDVIWDYHLLPHREKAEMRALILAVKKEIVQDIMSIVLPMKLEVEILDFTPLSIYNTLHFTGEVLKDKAVAIIDMGAQSTDIIMVEAGEIAMVRPIPLGGDNLTQAIAQSFNINFFEAEKLKQGDAFIPTIDNEISSEKGRKLFSALHPTLEELLDEIRRSIGYYRSQLRGSNIGSLIFTGGGIQFKNIDRFIEENLRIKATRANPFSKLPLPAGVLSKFPEPSIFFVALGLGLRLLGEGKIKINLLPPLMLQRVEFKKKKPVLIASFVLVFLTILVYAGIIRQKAAREELILKGLNDTIANYTNLERTLKPKREEKQKILKSISEFQKISRERTFWLDILNEVTYLIPDGIILESFSPSAGEAGPQVVLEGLAPNFGFIDGYSMISAFISHLELSPVFENVGAPTGKEIELDEKQFVKFAITLEISKEEF